MTSHAAIRAKKSIRSALMLIGSMFAGTLMLTLVHKQFGLIDSDTTTRGIMVLIGLMLVAVGNGMPKRQEGPVPQTLAEVITRQAVLRVGGWAMMLGGLVWVVLWTVAPRDFATVGSIAAVATATLVMCGYTILRYRRYRSSAR